MTRLLITTAFLLGVAGCEGVTPLAINSLAPLTGPTAMLTLPQTKKLPTDHVASWITGRDCSIISYEKDGVLCPDSPKKVDISRLYCIKTLGSVECHQRPDPYYSGQQILGTPPVTLVERQ